MSVEQQSRPTPGERRLQADAGPQTMITLPSWPLGLIQDQYDFGSPSTFSAM